MVAARARPSRTRARRKGTNSGGAEEVASGAGPPGSARARRRGAGNDDDDDDDGDGGGGGGGGGVSDSTLSAAPETDVDASSEEEEEEEEGEGDEQVHSDDVSSPSEADDSADEDFGRKPAPKKRTPAVRKRAAPKAAAARRTQGSSKPTARAKAPRSAAPGASSARTKRGGGGGKVFRNAGAAGASVGGSREELAIAEDNNLFNAIRDEKHALQTTVEDWVASYQTDEGAALAELVTCVLRACGCNGTLTRDEAQDLDGVVDKLDDLQDAFKKASQSPVSSSEAVQSYPLVSKTKSYKKFRKFLADFVERLVESTAEAEVLFDGTFCETLQAWIPAMSSSTLRSFRHTATVLALWIISGLCTVSAQTQKELANAHRQRDAEKKKSRTDKTRLQGLEANVERIHGIKTKLDTYLEEFVNSVFIHRFRDADAGIRAECVKELGAWMKKFPDHFLEGAYFRYLGWVLSDAEPSVRIEAVKAMMGLYSKEEFVGSVQHFTELFKKRLVQMGVSDVDLSVRVATIEVLIAIDRHGLLDEAQRNSLAMHIYDNAPPIRNAVAGFVAGVLEEIVEEKRTELPSDSDRLGKRKRKVTVEEAQQQQSSQDDLLRVKCLASLLAKFSRQLDEMIRDAKASQNASLASLDGVDDALASTNREDPGRLASSIDGAKQGRIGLAVEALWQSVPAVRQWKPIVELLLMDHSTASPAKHPRSSSSAAGSSAPSSTAQPHSETPAALQLHNSEEAVLIEALVAVLRKNDEVSKANGAEEEDEQKADATRTLINALPRLIARHQTDPGPLADLLLIPQLMNLDLYLDLRMTTAYDALWDDVSKQYLRQDHPVILRHCVDTLRYMMSATSLANTNAAKFAQLEEDMMASLREATDGRDLETWAFGEDETALLSASMLRLVMLFGSRDLFKALEEDDEGKMTSGWDIVFALASRGRLGYREEEQMVENALRVLTFYIMWKYRACLASGATASSPQVVILLARRSALLDALGEYVTGEQSNACHGVRRTAFEQLLRVYILFAGASAPKTSANGDDVAGLATAVRLRSEEELQFRCAGFVQAEIDQFAEEISGDESADADAADVGGADDDRPAQAHETAVAAGKRANGDPNRLSQARLQSEHVFYSTISTFVTAIRLGVVDLRHAPTVLSHYDRFGQIYNQCARVVVDVLRDACLFGDEAVKGGKVVLDSMREAFELFMDGQVPTDDACVSLSRALGSSLLARGAQLVITKRVDPAVLVKVHTDAITYAVNLIAGHERNKSKGLRNKAIQFFKSLAHLLVPAQPRDALKIKSHLDQALKRAEIEPNQNSKTWSALTGYEKRLVSMMSRDQVLKAPVPAAPAGGDDEERGSPLANGKRQRQETRDEDVGGDENGDEGGRPAEMDAAAAAGGAPSLSDVKGRKKRRF